MPCHGTTTAREDPVLRPALVIALVPMNLVWPYLTNSGMSQVFFVVLGLTRAAMDDSGLDEAGEPMQSSPVAIQRGSR